MIREISMYSFPKLSRSCFVGKKCRLIDTFAGTPTASPATLDRGRGDVILEKCLKHLSGSVVM